MISKAEEPLVRETFPGYTCHAAKILFGSLGMAREFEPVRFFVMMAVAAFLVCGITAFYTHRAEHGRTSDERSAYVVGKKAGAETAAAGGKLPSAADLNGIAQRYYLREGSGAEPMAWKLAFEHGYEDVFNKRN